MATGIDTSALYYYFAGAQTGQGKEAAIASEASAKIDAAYDKETEILIPAVVVTELANLIDYRFGREKCTQTLDKLLDEKKNRILPTSPLDVEPALIISKRTGVKYTDCLIYLTLKRDGTTRLITSDKEFRQFKDLEIV